MKENRKKKRAKMRVNQILLTGKKEEFQQAALELALVHFPGAAPPLGRLEGGLLGQGLWGRSGGAEQARPGSRAATRATAGGRQPSRSVVASWCAPASIS